MSNAASTLTLGRGSIFEIVATNGVVRCSVVNRSDVAPEEGARCAAEMHEILERDVLAAGGRYLGLVFDVRRGPEVFGPKTRESLEKLFRLAERANKRLAVRVGVGALQRLQFTSLCAECAPTVGKLAITDEEEEWARRPAIGRPRA